MHAFWEIVASNALLVTVLALGVALLGRAWKNPAGLHVLWVLVLLKLFTPPIVTIGLPLPVTWAAPASQHCGPDNGEAYLPVVDASGEELADVSTSAPQPHVSDVASRPGSTDTAIGATVPAIEQRSLSWSTILAWTWCLGITVFAAGHAYRVLRFRRLLHSAQPPPADVHRIAERIGKQLGLKRVPEILTLPVRLSPLIWSIGGRPRVVLPAELLKRLDLDAQEAILVHELAHVRRRDHLVRLLELVATTVFWWHPVVWWASRQLRGLEEQCCDAAVLQTVPHGPRTYATALVDTLDFLSETSVAAPVAATAAKSPLSVARRIEMLTNHANVVRLTPRRILLLAAVAALPMAVAFAAEAPRTKEGPRPEAQEPSERLAADESTEGRGSGVDDAAQAEPAGGEEKSEEVRVGLVEELAVEEPGARAVRFSVDVPKGRRFRVTLKEVPTRIYAPASFVFENERDEPALVEIRFEYQFEHKGDKSRDVLLSEEKDFQYEAKVEGCYPGGMTTITGVPLGNLARSEKKLILVPPDDELSKARSGVRVLLIAPKKANPRTSEEVERLEPRGELIVSLQPMPDTTRKPDPVEQLRRAWKRGARAIGTAYIKYRRYRVGPSSVKRIPHESVDALLSSFGPAAPPEKVLPVVREVLEAESQEHWSSDWGTHVFRCVGLKSFDTYVREGEFSSARFFDGEIDVSYDTANRQANVYRAGDSNLGATTLSDFRIVAPVASLTEPETSLLEDGRVRLSNDRIEIVADPSTGFIHRYVLRDRDGHVQTQSLQYGPTSYPGGVCYPRLKLHFGYRKGKLYSIDVIVVDEARFNEGFSDADFALPLPAGTLVVDRREDTFRPRRDRLTRDVDDAGAYFGQPMRLRFNFRFEPWENVLPWLAEEAGLRLVMDAPPPGVFNYQDERSHSVAEAIELLNGVLRPSGYELVRHKRTLRLVKLEEGSPKQTGKKQHLEIIVAEHVILMDGELVTPPEVEQRLREQAAAGPVRPWFHFTAGAFQAGKWKTWHDRALHLHRELRFSPGVTFGSVSHPASRRYDAIRTADDLRPDPSRRIEGTARLADGRPAAGATVVVREPSGLEWLAIYLHDGGLRDPVDEVWTKTDEQGRFAIYPAEDRFSVAVLHPDGFAAATSVQLRQGEPIVLQAWATIDLTLRRSPDQAIGAALSVNASPAPDAVPLNFDVQLGTGDESRVSSKLLVPRGSITVSTMIPLENGVSVSVSHATFEVGPGETKQIELGPPTEEDVERAEQRRREARPKGIATPIE